MHDDDNVVELYDEQDICIRPFAAKEQHLQAYTGKHSKVSHVIEVVHDHQNGCVTVAVFGN